LRYSPPTTALRHPPSRHPFALFFPALRARSRKASGPKSRTLRAQRERLKSFCETWTTVYSDHNLPCTFIALI
jgi:hypothetical protein